MSRARAQMAQARQRVQLCAKAAVTGVAFFDFKHGSPNFDLHLYDPGGTPVAASEFATRQEELGYTPTVTGSYTLRVLCHDGSGSYVLDASAGAGAPAPGNCALPSTSGVAQAGGVLTASTGVWISTGIPSYSYQWRRCDGAGAGCADIAAATSQSYVIVTADVGATLRIVVTATNAAGSGSATSAAGVRALPTSS